jgi:hypothetical protein
LLSALRPHVRLSVRVYAAGVTEVRQIDPVFTFSSLTFG